MRILRIYRELLLFWHVKRLDSQIFAQLVREYNSDTYRDLFIKCVQWILNKQQNHETLK